MRLRAELRTRIERLAANIAQERLLGMLERDAAEVVYHGRRSACRRTAAAAGKPELGCSEARRERQRAHHQGRASAAGQYSGLGLENELRRRMGVLGLPPRQQQTAAVARLHARRSGRVSQFRRRHDAAEYSPLR